MVYVWRMAAADSARDADKPAAPSAPFLAPSVPLPVAASAVAVPDAALPAEVSAAVAAPADSVGAAALLAGVDPEASVEGVAVVAASKSAIEPGNIVFLLLRRDAAAS